MGRDVGRRRDNEPVLGLERSRTIRQTRIEKLEFLISCFLPTSVVYKRQRLRHTLRLQRDSDHRDPVAGNLLVAAIPRPNNSNSTEYVAHV